jgi:diaminohydroxyphosphoribosylaminopyrimidine deaminase / 5-amino-6-(5-phosphoribosylamino)uracil reductase
MQDEALMRRALALAARAVGNTSPNPMVGAIVAGNDGEPIALGYHERAGSAHAEAAALEKAGDKARGATLFVTLEPCNHHGRTPPCTDAIVKAGVARVVVATEDEDPRVRATGIETLRKAGIRVDVGVGAEAARRLNRTYFHQRRTGRPFVTLKMAQSLDGAVGLRPSTQQKLTGKRAAAYVRSLRYAHDAVMVGVETAIVDDPQLTVRPHKERAVPYSRVIVDSTARLPLRSKIVTDQRRAGTIVAVTERAPSDRVDALRAAGVDVMLCRANEVGRVDIRDLLDRLGKRGMLAVLCEGGPALAGALLNAGLANEIILIVAPVCLGAAREAPVLAGLEKPVSLRVEALRKLDEDVVIVAAPT